MALTVDDLSRTSPTAPRCCAPAPPAVPALQEPFGWDSKQYAFAKADLAHVDRGVTPWVVVLFHASVYNTYNAHFKVSAAGRVWCCPQGGWLVLLHASHLQRIRRSRLKVSAAYSGKRCWRCWAGAHFRAWLACCLAV